MKVSIIIYIVYFVTKGTIVFCLDKSSNEKEIKEVKKSNSLVNIR